MESHNRSTDRTDYTQSVAAVRRNLGGRPVAVAMVSEDTGVPVRVAAAPATAQSVAPPAAHSVVGEPARVEAVINDATPPVYTAAPMPQAAVLNVGTAPMPYGTATAPSTILTDMMPTGSTAPNPAASTQSIPQEVRERAWKPAPAPEPRPRRWWRSRRFAMAMSAVVFCSLLVAGSYAEYKGTHHAADKHVVRQTAWPPVDGASRVEAVGANTAEQQTNKLRQQAVIAVRDALETFYTKQGHYPSTTDMANAAWAAANLKGITAAEILNPTGSAVAGSASRLAYKAAASSNGNACNNVDMNCNYYTLSATLSTGSIFTKTAMQ